MLGQQPAWESFSSTRRKVHGHQQWNQPYLRFPLGTAPHCAGAMAETKRPRCQKMRISSPFPLAEEHSCGLREDGVAVCWGDGGNETCTLTLRQFYSCRTVGGLDPTPQSPLEGERFASMSTDSPHCGLRTDGTPVCWTKYVDSGLTSPPEGEQFISISASPRHACGLRADGGVVCWGQNWFGQASPPDGKLWIETP